MIRQVLAAVIALGTLGCGHPVATGAVGPAANAVVALGDAASRLTPEQAQEKATRKARDWHADVVLVGTCWAVPKLELSSVVYHVFRSPAADQLLVVETRLTTWWQKTHEVTDKKLTLPARLLAQVERWPVDAQRALAIAKAQLPAGHERPVAMLALGRAKLAPPLWGVTADAAKVLIHAETGKVLAGGGQAAELLTQVVEAARLDNP